MRGDSRLAGSVPGATISLRDRADRGHAREPVSSRACIDVEDATKGDTGSPRAARTREPRAVPSPTRPHPRRPATTSSSSSTRPAAPCTRTTDPQRTAGSPEAECSLDDPPSAEDVVPARVDLVPEPSHLRLEDTTDQPLTTPPRNRIDQRLHVALELLELLAQ